jgi:hypothetical protein
MLPGLDGAAIEYGRSAIISWRPSAVSAPFGRSKRAALADGSEGEERPDHQRLSREGQHTADDGFEITH